MNDMIKIGLFVLGIYSLLGVLCLRQYSQARKREGGNCMLESELDFLERTPRAFRHALESISARAEMDAAGFQ
jgi:hypothetical protein